MLELSMVETLKKLSFKKVSFKKKHLLKKKYLLNKKGNIGKYREKCWESGKDLKYTFFIRYFFLRRYTTVDLYQQLLMMVALITPRSKVPFTHF